MSGRMLLHPAFVLVFVVLMGTTFGFAAIVRGFEFHLSKEAIYPSDGRVVSAVPTETDNWVRLGTDRIEPVEVVEELGTQNYLTRVFVEKEPTDESATPIVELHLAYYTGMIDTVPHVPERCFVGGGLQIGASSVRVPLALDGSRWVEDRDVPEEMAGRVFQARLSNRWSDRPGGRVRLPFDPHKLELLVTEFLTEGGSPFYSGYFFICNGEALASANAVRARAADVRDKYSYYLKVQFTSRTAGSPEELGELASSLLNDLYPEIARCVPDWVEVVRGGYSEDSGVGEKG